MGPAALAFTAATEAGLVGYDMLAEGKTFKEAVGDSVLTMHLDLNLKLILFKREIKDLEN